MKPAKVSVSVIKALLPFGLLMIAGTQTLKADELDDTFAKIKSLVAEKNYTKAMEELSWAQKSIEKMNQGRLQTFFPDALQSFQGGKFESNAALGFLAASRPYSAGEKSIKVELTTGSAGGGAQAGLGSLAAIGKMAAMMGNQPGQETVRIAGRTATLETADGETRAALTIFMDSGAVLKFEQQASADASALKKFAEGFDLDGIDKYLRGQA